MREKKFFIVGGAGFIGSHFCDFLLGPYGAQSVVVFDNFSSGQMWHIEHHLKDPRFKLIKGDAKSVRDISSQLPADGTLIHLASNPDIAKAITDPDIDFREGTALTNNALEAMRTVGCKSIIYSSGSGVYGDLGEKEAFEDFGPKAPISTYGASKLAGEALISAYSYMFGIRACVFRFANVVGPRQTHGVGFDFVRALKRNPEELRVLGDGKQSKSYAHVSDIISAVMTAYDRQPQLYEVYNIATGDYIEVNDIANIAIKVCGLSPSQVRINHTGGDRGWKGDVPVIRMASQRIRSLGWKNQYSSAGALEASMRAMLMEIST